MTHSTHNIEVLFYAVSASLSLALGFYLGAHFGARNTLPVIPLETKPELELEPDSDEEDIDLADGDLSSVKPGMMEPCKLVLVVRTDLKMTQGKIAAQCGYVVCILVEGSVLDTFTSHATLACYKALMKINPGLIHHWERTGQAKIALKGSSEEELLELEAIAKSLNLCARSILDAGRTQIAAGSRTVLGIGPAPVELVNQVTGHLKLL